jgi:hypothetical protein
LLKIIYIVIIFAKQLHEFACSSIKLLSTIAQKSNSF